MFEIYTFSQAAPEALNYQGRILNDGLPYTGYTNITLDLYDAATGGSQLFGETQMIYATDGFYSFILGESNTVGLAAALDNSDVYLQTTVGSTIMTPRERVVSSAYAIWAQTAATAQTAQVAVTAQSAPNYLPLTGGTLSGALTMRSLINVYSFTNIVTGNDNVGIGNGTRAYSTLSGSVAIGANATARYRRSGVAIGSDADGDYNGIAIGYSADGQYSNIAVGYAASAYSGYDRIAIGRSITNRRNDSCVIRGTLYLDGGTGLLYRTSTGSGSWHAKAFTIPHPLDPDNRVLRHYCLEGPQVWNVYAGNVQLQNGRAVVTLPDYYTALNLPESEVYSLTPVGGQASLYIAEEVADGRFVIGGDADVKVSWTVKVLRNDPGCLKSLEEQPVEQPASELIDHRRWRDLQRQE
jgi:hypothetical protein